MHLPPPEVLDLRVLADERQLPLARIVRELRAPAGDQLGARDRFGVDDPRREVEQAPLEPCPGGRA
jgi:hypothetical protein